MPKLITAALTTGAVTTVGVPLDLASIWIRNTGPFDLAVSFDPSPAPPPAVSLTDYQFSPQWVDVVPARRSRHVIAPPSAGLGTPQGVTPQPGSGKVTLFPWPDPSVNNFYGSAPAGTARIVAYSLGETPGRDDGAADGISGTTQQRQLAALPSAQRSYVGQWAPGAAGATLVPFPGTVGKPYLTATWNGTTTVVAYVYSLVISHRSYSGDGRVQLVETGGSATVYDLVPWGLNGDSSLPFTPASPHPVVITPSAGSSLLSLRLICDALSNPALVISYSIAVDVDSRNSEPTPALGYGYLASDAFSGNVRAAGYW